jgi:hypothetical protein
MEALLRAALVQYPLGFIQVRRWQQQNDIRKWSQRGLNAGEQFGLVLYRLERANLDNAATSNGRTYRFNASAPSS